MILDLGAQVEENLRRVALAVADRDTALAQLVIDTDVDIDRAEVLVEDECLKFLALHQPVAVDLRLTVSVLKINHDLERIGDHAVNIAERVLVLAHSDMAEVNVDFLGMASKAQRMLKNSLDAFVSLDVELAREVWAADDEVDDMYTQISDTLIERMKRDPAHLRELMYLQASTAALERVADHSANIAKDVVYMVEGDIVRHSGSQAKGPQND